MDAVTLGMAKADAARRRAPMGRGGGTLHVFGNSYAEGFGIAGFSANPAGRYSTRFARRLGLTEINHAISGSELGAPTSPAWRGITHRVLSCVKPGTEPSQTALLDVVLLQVAQNEAGNSQYYANTNMFKAYLRRAIQRLRESMFWEAETGGFFSLTNGGGSAWSAPSLLNNEGSSSGPGARSTSSVGNVATLSIPATFPGGEVILHGWAYATQGVLMTVTVDGVSAGTWDSRDSVSPSAIPVPHAKSVGVLTPGAHTIVATVTDAPGALMLDGAGVTAANPPLVVLPNYIAAPTMPAGPSTHTPITSGDRTLFNSYMATVVAEFTDGQVKIAPVDISTTNAALWGSDSAHPSSLGHKLIEEHLWTAVSTHRRFQTQPDLRGTPAATKLRMLDIPLDGGAATVTLAAGTGTLSSRALTTSTRAILQRKTQGAAPGFLSYTISGVTGSGAGTLTITSSNAADTGQVEVFLYDLV